MDIKKPSKEFFSDYLTACKESYENNVTEWMPFDPENYESWKENILRIYYNLENGIDIPEGIPRTYTFWCIEDNTFIGEIQIRPYLTESEAHKWGHIAYAVRHSQWNKGYGTKLLKASIYKLKEFNVSEIYIACHTDNSSSIRVIEKNQGVLVKSITDDHGVKQNIYVIKG